MLHQGLLYRKLRLKNRDEDTYQFVVPSEFRRTALSLVHDSFGHLGIDRSTVLSLKVLYIHVFLNRLGQRRPHNLMYLCADIMSWNPSKQYAPVTTVKSLYTRNVELSLIRSKVLNIQELPTRMMQDYTVPANQEVPKSNGNSNLKGGNTSETDLGTKSTNINLGEDQEAPSGPEMNEVIIYGFKRINKKVHQIWIDGAKKDRMKPHVVKLSNSFIATWKEKPRETWRDIDPYSDLQEVKSDINEDSAKQETVDLGAGSNYSL